jgi:ATP-dependent exoDNAse (exonuclease V) beta subunit
MAIQPVIAGAGTGKTYHIATRIGAAMAAGLAPDGLIATTFTRKAAGELQERIQVALASAGQHQSSQDLLDALIGTVNSVCGRLLGEFSLDAGLSPDLAVLDEAGQTAAFEAAVAGVVANYEPVIGPIAHRLCYDGIGRNRDWTKIVRGIAQDAEANRLSPGDVLACLPSALNGILGLLHAPVNGAAMALDIALKTAMDGLLTVAAGWNPAVCTQGTQTALNRVQTAHSRFDPSNDRFLTWAEWAALANLAPGAAHAPAFAPVRAAASAQDSHPRLHDDIEMLVRACYLAASQAMVAYAAHKTREGVLDFCDQEALLLDLLQRNAAVRDELAQRLRLLVVDEFQDTSPLQLALFQELAKLGPATVWVGDPKQAIYGFRGTDPALMQAALKQATAAGTATVLGTSYRARPDLVAFANALFVPAFAGQGMPGANVALKANRLDPPGMGPALHAWRLPKEKEEIRLVALAAGIARLAADPDRPPVVDRSTNLLRPLRPGDMAVLCKTNEAVTGVAEALQACGLRVAAARDGLLDTPEVRLACACLRRLASGRDALAAAEIAHLCDPAGSGAWLIQRLADPAAVLDARVGLLDAARARDLDLSPAAALSEAIAVAGVLPVISAWPDPAQRLSNIEALFVLATQYQETCRTLRRAATAGGLVAWLRSLRPAPMQPASVGEDAVAVLTYHKAKGLEWPLVVMAQLGFEHPGSPFGVTVEAPAAFDSDVPLAGRQVRFWPWPYGQIKTNVQMAARAAQCPEHAAAEHRISDESVRLGYVGVTRARDHLVLALEPKPIWLDRFAPGLGNRLQQMPTGTAILTLDNTSLPVAVTDIPATGPGCAALPATVASLPWPVGKAPTFPPARLSPSRIATDAIPPAGTQIVLGPRLVQAATGRQDAVGEALHRFLAADDPKRPQQQREDMAAALFASWDVPGALLPEHCVLAADRLWRFVRERYGEGAEVLREWPVQARRTDDQQVRGRVDMLVRWPGGVAVVDHKSFPGEDSATRAAAHVPQLRAYAGAMAAIGGEECTEVVVHLPVLGMVWTFGYTRP